MIPFELNATSREFRDMGRPTIVLATGSDPRHTRFALRMQQEFARDVLAWFQYPKIVFASKPPKPVPEPTLKERVKGVLRPLIKREQKKVAPPPPPRPSSIFLAEIERLQQYAVVPPTIVAPEKANEVIAAELRRVQPFFFLTLGGGLYNDAVLNAVRGLAINQHAGFSPDYKGNQTTYQALYHRDLRRVASTVHITTTGADAGPILRRSNPCLMTWDTPVSVAERVVALGTEMMIECVHEIRDTGRIQTFEQPLTGITYLSKDFNAHVRSSVQRDFDNGWMRAALTERQTW